MSLHRASGAGEGQTEGPCCAVCSSPITAEERATTSLTEDPAGNWICAHFDCLRNLGEFEVPADLLEVWVRG